MTPFAGRRDVGNRPGPMAFTPGQNGLGGIPCGTIVLTLDGEIPVEFLSVGDKIITRNSGATPLLAVEVDTVREHGTQIAAGSLGDTRPEADQILPASQPVLLRDWRAKALFGQPQAVVPIGALVDHGFIRDLGEMEFTLHRLVFARDQVIYAGGLELLSVPVRSAIRPAA